MRQEKFRRVFKVLVVIVALVVIAAQQPVQARGGSASCYDQWVDDTTLATIVLGMCDAIQREQDEFFTLGDFDCGAQYFSNVIQAGFEYTACMTAGKLIEIWRGGDDE